MKEQNSPYFSRSAAVMVGKKAWAVDGKFRLYAYDGARFWRRREHSTRYASIPEAKAPAFGWMHDDGCTCHLCHSIQREVLRAA